MCQLHHYDTRQIKYKSTLRSPFGRPLFFHLESTMPISSQQSHLGTSQNAYKENNLQILTKVADDRKMEIDEPNSDINLDWLDQVRYFSENLFDIYIFCSLIFAPF